MQRTNEPTNQRTNGFTFVELFVVLALSSILSLAVYATFFSGMRMYKRVNEVTLVQRKLLLGLERFSQEARQILDYNKIGFAGKINELSFPIVVDDEINRVTYLLEQGTLVRKLDNFKDILDKNEKPKIKTIVSDVEDLKFNFAFKEPDKEDYTWKDSWDKEDGLPLIVKLELKVKNEEPSIKSIIIPLT